MAAAAAAAGICICSELWRQAHPSDVTSTLAVLLQAANYRIRFSQIAPDFIFNNAGLSVAFILVMDVEKELTPALAQRIVKLQETFKLSYVVVTLSKEGDYKAFADFYLSLSSGVDKPAFLPVPSLQLGLEKIIRMSHVHAECKRGDITGMVDLERKQFVQSQDALLSCMSSIPGLRPHDVHALAQGFGSIEAMSRQSSRDVMHGTDLSAQSASALVQLFNDTAYGNTPKLL